MCPLCKEEPVGVWLQVQLRSLLEAPQVQRSRQVSPEQMEWGLGAREGSSLPGVVQENPSKLTASWVLPGSPAAQRPLCPQPKGTRGLLVITAAPFT